MDSDSDSDCSHISTTPPRDLHPPPPPPCATNPRYREPRAKPKSATAKSRPSLKPKAKPKPKPKSKPSSESSKPFPKRSEPDPPPIPIPSPDLSSLPFQIRRPLETEIQAFPVENSVPAGGFCLSKFASFSKIRRPCPDFTEEEDPNPDQTKLPPDTEGDIIAKPVKALKRHPNLIGGTSTQTAAPVKKPKCVSEGNFVRLNINGYGSKYKPKSKFKGNRKSYGAYSGRRSFQRSSRKRKDGDENGDQSEGFGDEEGLVLENHQLGKKGSFEMDEKLLEEIVLSVRDEPSDDNLLKLLKLTHGYDSFRDGQLEAIKMILSGKSTMLVLPTGAGKSLCYQLPAMVLQGVTLVVSPLVALMIDQLKQLPSIIKGGLLSSSQTPDEMSETLQQLQEGSLKVLFVSPERFLNAEFISVFSDSPIISLVVVDEAHCVSEWSHNFRPSYMRLRASLLRRLLNVQCIFAMTATATPKTLDDVMCALEIPPTNIIKEMPLRDNLQLSVTSSTNRLKDLMTLIKSKPFVDVQSIIIYCKYQSETDSISKYLRDSNISALSYHSGIPTKERKRIQESFCSNKIRVVVATVAFGMGLDKSNVGAIIHYTLPESLEEYVQEIGRAGRDGRVSYCHLLFDDKTYFKLRSLTYSDGVDEYAVSRFLSHVFSPDMDSNGNIHSLAKESASRKFDMKEEVMLTILTQLELGEVQYLRLLPQINTTCTLNFHDTAPTLLAAKDNAIAAILKKSDIKHGQYVFDVPTVANCIRISATDLLNRLQMLKAKGEITFEMKDQAYCYTIMDVPKDICSLTSHLTNWLSEVESCKTPDPRDSLFIGNSYLGATFKYFSKHLQHRTMSGEPHLIVQENVRKIDAMFDAAASAVKLCKKVNGCHDSLHTACLQKKIMEYFSGGDDSDVHTKLDQSSPFLRADIKVFLQSNSQAKFTPRAIARIMHGISSPAYPTTTWSKTHFWGRYAHINFQAVMEAAKAELMNFVGKNLT